MFDETTVDSAIADMPGVASVWLGPVDGPAVLSRAADAIHPAASTMKVAVLVALFRAAAAGQLDLDATVTVHNEFTSAAPGAPPYGCTERYDSDPLVWQRLDSPVRVGWLAERMIVRSSNLATNLVLAHVGVPAVAAVLGDAGARHSAVTRGIEDSAAADAGLANLVTARDLALVLRGIAGRHLAGPAECAAMLEILERQEFRDDLAAGLPAGTRVAGKNGWLRGIRHSAGVVFPEDAPPFVLAVCLSTPLAVNRHDDAACQIVARIAAAAWAGRHRLSRAGGPEARR